MKKLTNLLIVLTFIVVSCSEEEKEDNNIVAPASYSFERDGESTVSYSGQTIRIGMAEELISTLKDTASGSTLALQMYANQAAGGGDVDPFSDSELNASGKSIKSKVAASKDFFSDNATASAEIKSDFEEWIEAQYSEVYAEANTLAAPGQAGQIVDGSSVRYVNGKGLEYNQAVNKGLIGALMADQMLNNYLSPAVLDEADNQALNDAGTPAEGKPYTTMEHKWDEAYGYLFGASANGANPIPDLGEDSFLNKYLAKVDADGDFAGIAEKIFNAFKLGRAAIVAKDYDLRDEQANIIKDNISKVIAVRAVYYLQKGKDGIPETGNNYGPAFHDLSEGYGFIYSLQFTRKPNSDDPYFTAAEVEGFLTKLSMGNGFWDVSDATLDDISKSIAAKFDFTVEQAAD